MLDDPGGFLTESDHVPIDYHESIH